MSKLKGKISQIIGPVVDISFENADKLPSLLDAIEVVKEDGSKVVLECQKHIGEDSIRTIAMDSTDGLTKGMDVALGSLFKCRLEIKLKVDCLMLLEKQ